ncbi:MAG: HD domain-containing protein [Chloroflexi bacterium]|nr:HD domain-containing protein [Chloroflexota bacterium]MBI3733214.1 HD domain-containing protein [Chloroflexota bacterium]
MPTRHNTILQEIIARVNADEELYALWTAININAVDRLGMSDHGPVHVQIVANIALKLLRLLEGAGVIPSIARDHQLAQTDAEVVVVLAALLHDSGMSIHRIDHEAMSLFVARPIVLRLLDGLYPVGARTIILSEISHAIISHRSDGRPLTLEAGVVRVADALDMTEGRSRIPFEKGMINIHSLSAAAIEKVTIRPGEQKPIHIAVSMSNSAGIFQLDELLKEKLRGSGLEPYVEVEASITSESEKKLLQVFRL